MRVVGVFLSLLFLGSAGYCQESGAETALGESLVNAIVAEDIVAYSQCWVSIREGNHHTKSLGVEIPDERLPEMRSYMAKRNQTVVKSFQEIQKLIRDHGIERKIIQLKSCVANGVRERKMPKGTLQQAGSFTIELTVGEDVWKMEIDDGVMANGLWYFSDSPTSIHAGKTYLSFKEPQIENGK